MKTKVKFLGGISDNHYRDPKLIVGEKYTIHNQELDDGEVYIELEEFRGIWFEYSKYFEVL